MVYRTQRTTHEARSGEVRIAIPDGGLRGPRSPPESREGGGAVESAIDVVVNGVARELAEGTSVRALLSQLEIGGARIAVAVNRQVVPRSTFDTHQLAAGDRVEILEAVGGGS